MKIIVLSLCALLLTACVTEDGTRKHKGRQGSSLSDMGQWRAIVHGTGKHKNGHGLGIFGSRDECMQMAMQYMEQHKRTVSNTACALEGEN